MKVFSSSQGFTLTELMVAVALLSVGVLGFIAAFGGIGRVVQESKSKSLASNLAQERVEDLKNISYPRLLVTTSTVSDARFSPALEYDGGFYPKETLRIGGIPFERAVRIRKVQEDAGGDLEYVVWNQPDTGLKELVIYVIWSEGGKWKKLELRNLRDDPNRLPLDATFSGTVTSSLGPEIVGARVEILENTSWNAATDGSGNYSFRVAAGSYTLRASRFGYFSATRQDLSIANGDISDQDFSLVPKASGTVSGIAYLGDHLVLSQVVASTVNASNGFNQEYVELYNPTTWTWTLSGSFNLTIFYEKTSPYACKELGFNTAASCALEAGLTFVNSTIASQGYFLIANTDTLRAGGVTVTADAYYDEGVTGNVIEESKGGGVGLLSNNVPLDRAGWTRGNAGESSGPNTTETSGLVLNKGLDPGEQIARAVSSSTVTSTQGNAWDSQNNSSDFNLNVTTVPSANHDMSLTFAPRASASTLVPISGTPARGALISVTDGLSSAATASGSGSFQVVEVATGSWRVVISSGTLFAERLNVSVSASANTGLGSVTLTSSTADGIVSGRVTDGAAGLPNIAVAASGGQDVTNSGGYYSFSIATGTYDVTANPGNQDASYTLGVVTGVVVSVGQIASGVDFALSQGGRLRGFVSTNGVDPLPGVAIDAEQGGLSRGSGISGPDGYFLIGNLPVGTYEVGAYPSSGETVSPSTYSATVASDATVFVGTYTVSGAFGKIAGDLTTGGSAPITIGVLVLASTATISEPPPAINASLRSGAVFYYAVSSFSDGTYELAVPPGSYNLAAWYTTFSGETPTTNRQSGTATVAAGQTQTVDLNW